LSRRPEITVAIPSHRRARRLRALLDGLAAQTLAPERFEVVVCHTPDEETEQVLADHPLAEGGRLRALRLPPGERGPALQRNRAWRVGRADLVAFMDDDCRPHPNWLAELLAVARAHPGAIVEGATRPDPLEEHHLGMPYARTLWVDPPSPWGATCNICYPRELLERVGGFDERFALAGEDTDLLMRALDAGALHVGAPRALAWHAVDPGTLVGRLRTLPRWRHAVLVVRRHPRVRSALSLGVFWRPEHASLVGALAGAALAAASRRPAWLALALPWLVSRAPRYGASPRALAASARDTAGRLVVDAAEVAVMGWGSARHRTFVL
jgi:GT2 family glycosyltransferase